MPDSCDILVIGHSGFVGSALVRAFEKNGICWTGASRSNGFDLQSKNIASYLPKARIVIHTAGMVGVAESWTAPDEFIESNVAITLRTLEYARMHGTHLIYFSTYVYGVPKELPIAETHPSCSTSPYTMSKILCERLVNDYCALWGLSATILRPFNLYGPGQNTSQLIASVVSQAISGPLIFVKDLVPRRDYVWIDDLADVVLRIVRKPNEGTETFNVATGESRSVQEIIDQVTAIVGPREVVSAESRRSNEILDCIGDANKLSEKYGWRVTTSFESGLRRLVTHCTTDART